MNLARVALRGFMSHANTVFTFPAKGLVAITGANGAGKSSIVEAVSVGGWGKTLRGTEPWNGTDCGLDLATSDAVEVSRTVKKSSKSLSWKADGKAAVQYETNTKAQDALETRLGSWDVWRRSSVFSSQDASHFTLATDAERKRLLETILGLERFDLAADHARGKAAMAAANLSVKEREAAVSESQRSSAVAAAEVAARALAAHLETEKDFEDVSTLEATAKKLSAEIETAETTSKRFAKGIEGATTDLVEAERAVGQMRQASVAARAAAAIADERARRAKADLARLASPDGTCPTCEQPMGTTKRDRLKSEADAAEQKLGEAKKAADEARAKADKEVESASANLEELREERDDLLARAAPLTERIRSLHTELSRVETALRRATAAEATRARLQKELETAERAREAKIERATQLAAAVTEASIETRTYEACVKVLGTKGVRAHILGSALGGMEVIANQWLARLKLGIAVTVSAYTEKKTGGQSDAISLNFVGIGGGHGYRGASGGERRRVDVALLLALGEIAAAAHGKEPGTLFIDEVFDSLDVDGVQAVASVLRELAQSRCVVVITHNTELVSAMRADKHYVVSDGKVTEE